MSLPLSRRAFQRALPLRLGSIEDHLDIHEQRVDKLVARLAAIEAHAEDKDLRARVDLIEKIVDLLKLALGKRQSRRRTAAARH
jgi:hypothetical protein